MNIIDFYSYSQVIVEYPMTVLISCTVVLFACSLAGILTGPLPDFSDPLLVSICTSVTYARSNDVYWFMLMQLFVIFKNK